jgi:hypothetical protein
MLLEAGANVNRIYLFTSDDASSLTVQAQIDKLNDLPQDAILLYSPTLGTGVDIQARFEVFGVFAAQPLTATEIWQAVGRVRNPIATHLFVEDKAGNAPTDASDFQAHYEREVARDTHSALWVDGRRELPGEQRPLVALMCEVEARRNASLNRLHDHAMDLGVAMGYTLVAVEGKASKAQIAAQMEARQKSIEQRRADILAATPLDGDAYAKLQRKGKAAYAEAVAHEKHLIMEAAQKMDVGAEDIEALDKEEQRAALSRFRVMVGGESAASTLDYEEVAEGTPAPRLKHHAANRLVARLLLAVLGQVTVNGDGTISDITPKEIAKSELLGLLAAFFGNNNTAVTRLLPLRRGGAIGEITQARRILERLGLRLTSRAATTKAERERGERLYSLNADLLAKQMGYARNTLEVATA